MANGIRTGDPRGFNKGHSLKFRKGSRVRQTPKEGWRTYRPKRCGNNNKDEDNSPKTLNDKNQQALCQKFRQLRFWFVAYIICQHGQILISCTIPSGSPFPLVFVFFLCQFAVWLII